jgi:hypothetical protein
MEHLPLDNMKIEPNSYEPNTKKSRETNAKRELVLTEEKRKAILKKDK